MSLNAVAFLLDAPPKDAVADESWVQIAKTGRFQDPRYGKFSITTNDFSRWIKNFNNISIADGREGLPVDRDHSPEKRGDTEAVGWVKALEQRGAQLWAKVQWNPLGKELIAEKRYAYISPSYSNDLQTENGDKIGTALVGIALTNRPFLQMATVNLSTFSFAKGGGGDDRGIGNDDVTDLDDMDLDDDTDLDWSDGDDDDQPGVINKLAPHILDISDAERQKHAVVVKKVGGNTKHMFPIPPGDKLHARLAKAFIPAALKAGHITESDAARIRARADEVLGTPTSKQHSASYSLSQMELTQVLTAMGLSRSDLGIADDADDATVLAAITAHQEKVTKPAPGTVTLDQGQVDTLLADAAAGRAAAEQLRVQRFDTAFATAQQEGKVVPAQKETFRTLYDTDAEHTMTLMEGLQPVVNMEPLGSGGEPGDLGERARTMLSDFQDANQPSMAVDTVALRLHANAVALSEARNIPYEKALELAESGVTA